MKTNERKYDEKPVGLYWSNGKLFALIHRVYYNQR